MSEVRLELLLGRRVLDRDGRAIGRLEEVRAERDGDECLITDYLIGPAALLERLAAPVLRVLGFRAPSHAARWEQLDLSDPEKPRLTCSVAELRTLRGPRPKKKTEAEKERAEERTQRAAEARKHDEHSPKEQPELRHQKEQQERGGGPKGGKG